MVKVALCVTLILSCFVLFKSYVCVCLCVLVGPHLYSYTRKFVDSGR